MLTEKWKSFIYGLRRTRAHEVYQQKPLWRIISNRMNNLKVRLPSETNTCNSVLMLLLVKLNTILPILYNNSLGDSNVRL